MGRRSGNRAGGNAFAAGKRHDHAVSLVVPTYNERENVGTLVEAASAVLWRQGISFEILIVDDDSPDGTAEAAEALAEHFPVRTIVRRQ